MTNDNDSHQADLPTVIRSTLAEAPAPLTLTQLKKALTQAGLKSTGLQTVVQSMAEQGVVHAWPGTAKSPKYWNHEPNQFLAQAVLTGLAKGPATTAALVTLVKPLVTTAKALMPVLDTLQGAEQIFPCPPTTGSTWRWSLTAPSAELLLKKTLKAYRDETKSLAKKGVSASVLTKAVETLWAGPPLPASEQASEERLQHRLYTIIQLAADGGSVPLRELRRLTLIPKPDFDMAILALRASKRIHLHFHDRPALASEAERENMVTDGTGHYYVAAGIV